MKRLKNLAIEDVLFEEVLRLDSLASVRESSLLCRLIEALSGLGV